jgi:hypothetical protein
VYRKGEKLAFPFTAQGTLIIPRLCDSRMKNAEENLRRSRFAELVGFTFISSVSW